MSEITREKQRQRALERDLNGENNPNYGKKHTDEAKEKIVKHILVKSLGTKV